MIKHEIRDMFALCEDVQLEGTNNIGVVCNHFGGTNFRAGARKLNDRPFGLMGDPQDIVVFSKLLMDGHHMHQAREHVDFSEYKARKVIKLINAEAEGSGRAQVYAIKTKPGTIPIICEQTGVEFSSVAEAARAMGLPETGIHGVINGIRRSTKGYTFVPKGKEGYVFKKKAKKKQRCAPKRIVCNETGRIFPSIKAAARAMGLAHGNVCQHLKGNTSYTRVSGYTFRKASARPSIEIICDQTGKVFPSLLAASKAMKLAVGNICNHLKGHPYFKNVGGCTFSYGTKARPIEEYTKLLPKRLPKIEIICDQTQAIYPSCRSAAKALGLAQSDLSKHISGKPNKNGYIIKAVKGFTFRKVQRAEAPQPVQKATPVQKVESNATRAYWMPAPSSASFAFAFA